MCSLSQESIGTRSAPVGGSSGVNALSSPAKSTERVNSEEQKVLKLKPQALTNVTSEAVSTMSPPPAKRLALSAKKVSLNPPSFHLPMAIKTACLFAFPCLSTSFLVIEQMLNDFAHNGL